MSAGAIGSGTWRRSRLGQPPLVWRLTLGQTSLAVTLLGWVALSLGIVLLLGQGLKGVDPQDEGQFLTYPWLIAQGRAPYRDIWMSYPPATYLILVPFFKIGLPGIIVERSLGFLARVGYILLVNRALMRSWTSFSWLGVGVTFSTLFIASDLKPYPWLVAMPIFVCGLLLTPDRPGRAALVFFLAGLFRFEYGAAGVLALVALGCIDRRQARAALAAAAGLIVGLIALYGGLTLVTSGAAFRQIFVDQIVTVQRGRYVSLHSLPFGPLGIPVLALTLLAPPFMIVAGWTRHRADVVATNMAVLALMPHFFQRVDASHLFSTATLVLPWAVIGLSAMAGVGHAAGAESGVARRDWVSGALSAIGVGGGSWPALIVLGYAVYLSPLSPVSNSPLSAFTGRIVSDHQTLIAWDASEAQDDAAVAAFLAKHSIPGDQIFIVPRSLTSSYTRTDLYYLLGMPPATRYLEIQPNIETQPAVQREIMDSLSHCQWIVQVRGGRWYGPAANWGSHISPLERYIASHYRLTFGTMTYAVLRRSDAIR